MLQLKLRALTLLTPTGAVARVTDLTDWGGALPATRASWALLLSATRLGSLAAQDADLEPFSYEPRAFQSGENPAGTVDVPLPADGVYRLRVAAVPVLADAAAQLTAIPNHLYYRADLASFGLVLSPTTRRVISTWAELLAATLLDPALAGQLGETYALAGFALQGGLARLNLRYLEAGPRTRQLLVNEYAHAELLSSGASRQFAASFYADAATSLLAAQRQLGACLPAFDQSLPALPA